MSTLLMKCGDLGLLEALYRIIELINTGQHQSLEITLGDRM